jgi:hypothetical protein
MNFNLLKQLAAMIWFRRAETRSVEQNDPAVYVYTVPNSKLHTQFSEGFHKNQTIFFTAEIK